MENKDKCYVKFCVLGAPQTGKSSIIERYVDDLFVPSHHPYANIGVQFRTKNIDFGEKICVVQMWDHCHPIDIFIVGSKCDLQSKRVIGREEAIEYANQHASQYFEVSSKDNINIQQKFDELASKYFDSQLNDPLYQQHPLPQQRPPPSRWSCSMQ
ncbi:hypothetical protein CYY_002991 [Polysphondylium violaceum]|uniref:Rab GTPase n=1 Tax=Polysphondylium violaceum TaxID=133409 RepID=A0A8J4PVE6_9MYCE|nr:hypothetical protein CYY_002991 [Polysphondylium violaceum]